MSVLEINGLNKSYGKFKALQDFSLNIQENKIIGLLGPNGSGKTTLIKIIMGLISDYSGNVAIDGLQPGAEANSFISYLPDKSHIPSWLKVSQALKLFEEFYADFNLEKAENMLKTMEIPMDKKIKQLSRGMREKVSLSLIMSRRAKLFVLDEPIGAVDPASRDFIIETILKNFEPGSSLLLSTHIIADIEPILDNVVFLKKGEIILNNEADAIREESGKSIDELFREVFKNVF